MTLLVLLSFWKSRNQELIVVNSQVNKLDRFDKNSALLDLGSGVGMNDVDKGRIEIKSEGDSQNRAHPLDLSSKASSDWWLFMRAEFGTIISFLCSLRHSRIVPAPPWDIIRSESWMKGISDGTERKLLSFGTYLPRPI